MAVSELTNNVVGIGNGSSTVFSFSPVIISKASDLVVVLSDTDGTETEIFEGTGSDAWSISVSSFPGTGSITYPEDGVTPISTGQNISMKSVRALTQATDLENQGGYFADTQEEAFDKLTYIAQQQQEELDRTIQIGVTDITTTAAELSANVITLAAISTDITTVASISANVTTVSGISANVTTVAGISANVTTVAGISANVTTVAGDTTNIGIVAGDTTNIGIVAGISANITTVAGISANVTTVAGISTDVTTVAAIPTGEITTVAGISANITTVAGVSASVTTVAGISGNVTTVAGISGNVTTVAGISSDVTTVAADGADIGIVSGISGNVTTVAGISANVTTVAGISADVTTVAGISANVTTVAGIASDVTSVASQSFKYLFDSSIVMADPGSGDVRYNNATPASVTQIAISNTFSGGSDISDFINTWDDVTNAVARAYLVFRKGGSGTVFQIFKVTGAITDNTSWLQIPVTHVSGATLPTAADDLYIGSALSGEDSSVVAATQAEQETGSSILVFVSPGRQQYHQSASKAWVKFGAVSGVTVNASYNVSSVTDNATGQYTINFTNSFSSAHYGASSIATRQPTGSLHVNGRPGTAPTAGAFPLDTRDVSTLQVPQRVYMSFFGDQ